MTLLASLPGGSLASLTAIVGRRFLLEQSEVAVARADVVEPALGALELVLGLSVLVLWNLAVAAFVVCIVLEVALTIWLDHALRAAGLRPRETGPTTGRDILPRETGCHGDRPD